MAWRDKVLIGVMAGSALVPAGAKAQSSVTIYGLFDMGLEVAKSGSTRVTRQISGGSFGSRLGFRGVEDLGGGASAIFRLESGFTGDSGAFAQGGLAFGREASVGLSHRDWGTVAVGRIPTPFSLANANLDAFFWMGGGGMISVTRSTNTTTQLLPLVVSARADNAINYTSPNWNGFEVRTLASAGEGSTTNHRARSFSARYKAGAIDAVAAVARQYGAGPTGGKIESALVGGSYDFGVAKVYAGYTDEDNGCGSCTGAFARGAGVSGLDSTRFTLTNLGVRVPFGSATVIAQVTRVRDRSDYTVDPGSRDATWWAIGGEYNLAKRTALYGSVASIGNSNGSRYALGSGGVQQASGFASSADARSRAVVLGIRHLF